MKKFFELFFKNFFLFNIISTNNIIHNLSLTFQEKGKKLKNIIFKILIMPKDVMILFILKIMI